mgnify:CR=1 FL=1
MAHPRFIKGIKSVFTYVTSSTARTFTGLLVLSLIVGIGGRLTYAATAGTSWTVTDEVQMNLDVSINGTQTTGIILSAPQLNGSSTTFSTTSGGILRIRYGAYREDIYFTSATVAATKKVTLVGVTRNICPQHAELIVSCGNGRSWGKGAIVELTVDARLLNLKANKDRANTYTALQTFGSGVTITGTDEALRLSQVTTAERDAIVSPQNGMMVYNTTTGVINQYIAGSWEAVGTTGVSNASESAAGKCQIATIKAQSGMVVLGSSGAPNCLGTQYLALTGAVASQYGKIPTLSKTGTLTGSLLCTGNKNANGGKTVCTGTGGWTANSAGLYFDKTVYVSGVTSTTLTNTAVQTPFDTHSYTIPANDLVAGVRYEYECAVTFTYTSGDVLMGAMLGSTVMAPVTITPTGSTSAYFRGSIVGTTTAGAASPVRALSVLDDNLAGASGVGYAEVNIPTNQGTGVLLRFSANTSGTAIRLTMCTIRKTSTTAF